MNVLENLIINKEIEAKVIFGIKINDLISVILINS